MIFFTSFHVDVKVIFQKKQKQLRLQEKWYPTDVEYKYYHIWK